MLLTHSLDMVTEVPEDYRREDPPCPPSCKIELTSRCNYSCSFCSRAARPSHGEMTWELFDRIARQLKDAGVRHLGLFYLGEPFMVPWLPQAVHHAKRVLNFERVFVTTNGSLAKPAVVASCMANGLDSLKFSLNWADEGQHATVAGSSQSYHEQVALNVEAARKMRDGGNYACGIYGSFIRYDAEQEELMRARLSKLAPFLDEIYSLPLHRRAVTGGKSSWEYHPGAGGRCGMLRAPLPCWSLFRQAHVTFDGRLSACCFEHAEAFDAGDLTTTDFMSAWHSEAFRALRRAHLEGDGGEACRECLRAA